MKKKMPIFYIVLVNILILAHAIVPHHHHNALFVAMVSILDGESQSLFDHYHYNEVRHYVSTVDEYVVPDSAVDGFSPLQSNVEPDGASANSYGETFATDVGDVGLVPYPLGERLFLLKPSDAQVHSDFVACPIGLRAPPVC